MTILEVKGFSAWVQVNGKKLECYGISKGKGQSGSMDASCWIASPENETFSVVLGKPAKCFSHKARLIMDGRPVSGRVMSASETDDCVWSQKVDDETIRPFVFSSQTVEDDDTLLGMEASSNSLIGQIKITVTRITHLRYVTAPNPPKKETNTVSSGILPPIQKIHETCVKAMKPPHQIALGEAKPRSTSKKAKEMTYTNKEFNEKEIVATFTFMYRPLEILVHSGIAPAPEAAPEEIRMQPQDIAAATQDTHIQIMPEQRDISEPIASSSRSNIGVNLPASSSHRPDVASTSQATHADNIASAEERKFKFKDEVEDVDELQDEETLLLARLESVRSRKRKALADPDARPGARRIKQEASIPRGCFMPGEVIDLT